MGTLSVTNKYDLIKEQLNKHTELTINECITNIFQNDLTSGLIHTVDMGWKHYTHLNKLFAPMHKSGIIKQVGTKQGPTYKTEKVWALS